MTRKHSPSAFARTIVSLRENPLPLCLVIALFTAIVPFARAFFRVDIEYNEGWNVYNAATLVTHHLLYPVRYGWTTVNYPMLSFWLVAVLHRFTGDYLFTARALSLFGLTASSVLVGCIVRTLRGSSLAATLAGLFCFAAFCANANLYIGVDDPQIFAQTFYLLALLVYLRNRLSPAALTLAAFLFVLGGFTKHNLIDIPIAVLIDLAWLSLPRAVWFTVCGLLFTAAGVLIHIQYGGTWFFTQLLAPRTYSIERMVGQFVNVWAPLLLPVCIALYTAYKLRQDPHRRIASILLLTSTLIGGYFGGGDGVSINSLFTSMLAISILLGLFLDQLPSAALPGLRYVPTALFIWLFIPLIISGNWNPIRILRETAAEQQRFNQSIAYLDRHPGPVLCESLLLCYFANKPYIYDPFNATRLIEFKKLDDTPLLTELRHHQISAIELSALPEHCEACSDRFPPEVLTTIEQQYTPTVETTGEVIYTPKPASQETTYTDK